MNPQVANSIILFDSHDINKHYKKNSVCQTEKSPSADITVKK